MKNKLFSFLPFCFVLLLSLGAIFPLFHGGFFPMHDDTQVARVFEMGKSLKDGMFPVRWVADLGYGYGYPIFNFYAPLAYYAGGFLNLLLSNPLLATKIMIGLGVLLSGLTMFFLGKALWGKEGGILSGVLYVYAPYHAVDMYVRGDVAELWAYAFFPLAFLGAWMVYKKPSWQSMSLGAIGFAGAILSHNLSAFLFVPFFFAALLIVSLLGWIRKTKALFYAPLLFIFGMLLSAWYVLPVFGEMRFTNVLSQVGGSADFHEHFVCVSQLWQSPWGYGGSTVGCTDGLSFMIGKLQILFAIAALLLGIFLWKKSREKVWILLLLTIAALASIFLLLPNSKIIWESVSQMAFLQYPWRYLLLVSLFFSLIGGSILWLGEFLEKKVKLGIIVVLCVGITLFSLKYFVPQKFLSVDSTYYTNKMQLTWVTSKISDEYMPIAFEKPGIVQQIPATLMNIVGGTSTLVRSKTQEKIVELHAIKPSQVTVNMAYFPAWHLTLDGKDAKLAASARGMTFFTPEGTHTAIITFRQTTIEQLGNVISLASIGVVIIGILYARKKKR